MSVDVLPSAGTNSVIEEHHRCFGLGGYFMAAVLVAASYSRIGFSLYFAVRARRVRVPGGSKFHLEPVTIENKDKEFYHTNNQIPTK